jgi:hypothetical protein
MAHPYLSAACFLAWALLVAAFVRRYSRLNPSAASKVEKARPRWDRWMIAYLVGAFALYGVGIAL